MISAWLKSLDLLVPFIIHFQDMIKFGNPFILLFEPKADAISITSPVNWG